MQSSFNVIKQANVQTQGEKKITTNYIKQKEEKVDLSLTSEGAKDYEYLINKMVDNARKKSQDIIANTYIEIEIEKEKIFKEAYDKGYSEGFNSGYDKAMKKANEDGNAILENANKIFFSSKEIYTNYLDSKEDDIIDLIFSITETILKKELENKDAVNSAVINAISEIKGKQLIVVKCNSNNVESLKREIDNFKSNNSSMLDMVVLDDKSQENGKVTIEKENGKLVVDINYALDKVHELLRISD